ncbi:MAG: RNA polymerase sigma factor [Pseudomonadota bacterium]
MKQRETVTNLLPKLERRAQRLLGNTSEAEDLAQEAALRLWQQLQRAETIAAPERYAMVMLHNLARRRWRARRESEELTEDMIETAPLAPVRLAWRACEDAIAGLPPEQAAVLSLVLQGETSPRALAKRLNIPEGTVMSRLSRARSNLRRTLGLRRSVSELL